MILSQLNFPEFIELCVPDLRWKSWPQVVLFLYLGSYRNQIKEKAPEVWPTCFRQELAGSACDRASFS